MYLNWLALGVIVCVYLIYKLVQFEYKWQQIRIFCRTPAHPIFGHVGSAIGKSQIELRQLLEAWHEQHPSPMACKFPFMASIQLYKAEHVEVLLKCRNNITKSPFYHFVHCWLANGLLTSTGPEWQKQRKLLTPSFHFDILKEFIGVMDHHAVLLIKWIQIQNTKTDHHPIDVRRPVTLTALDMIAETSMGVDLNSFGINSDSEYAAAIREFGDCAIYRALRPLLHNETIWNYSPMGRRNQKVLHVLHNFTNKVIDDRMDERKLSKSEKSGNETRNKKKYALLELLLRCHDDGLMTRQEVKQQVDTFMFEGHDTIATALKFCCFVMAKETKWQKEVQNEIDSVLGVNFTGALTLELLSKMQLLERCIKETMRIYPPVPYYARTLTHKLKLEGTMLPKGIFAEVFVRDLHRNKDVWGPEPDQFNPDHFFPDVSAKRHPFAYVPFSGGPRNCIGQKFAMNELKITLCHLLYNFDLVSRDPTTGRAQSFDDLQVIIAMVLRPEAPIWVKFTSRR